jgi:YHS domain-containing protein
MLSRRGIAYNFKISPYKYTEQDITFYFSSQLHKDSFISKLKENRNKINDSLSNRFKIDVEFNKLADISLYKKIESRGFLLKIKGDYICHDEIKLGIEKVMKKS